MVVFMVRQTHSTYPAKAVRLRTVLKPSCNVFFQRNLSFSVFLCFRVYLWGGGVGNLSDIQSIEIHDTQFN